MSEDLNRKVDDVLANMRAPFQDREASWNQLSLKIDANGSPARKSIRPIWIGAAASIALAIGLFFTLTSDSEVTINTAMAQQEQVTLPDGSIVSLNADSRLSYDPNTFLDERNLTLDGEAFFEVQKGSSFAVHTDQGVVTVLGTSFNICDRKDFFEVNCVTGKVAVENKGQRVLLVPGMTCDNKQGMLSDAYAAAGSDGWRTGVYSFVADDLSFVLDEVARQFGVEIQTPDLSGNLYTGEFNSNDLETTLTLICGPMGLSYSLQGNSVLITTK